MLLKRIQFIVFSFLLQSALVAQENTNVQYDITISESTPATAHITITLKGDAITLYMAPGANHLENRWAEFVHNFKAVNKQGKSIDFSTSSAEWSLQSNRKENIIISYEIHFTHDQIDWNSGIDGAAYVNENGIFFSGRSLFILPQIENSSASLQFNLPEKWTLSTPWTSDSNNGMSFHVNSLQELSESIFFAGIHKEVSIEKSGLTLFLAIGDIELQKKHEELLSMADGVFEYYMKLMGGAPNLRSTENKILVVINYGEQTDGEVLGNNISMLIGKKEDEMSIMLSRFIFAHEFFHLWNGKSFTPDDLQSEWFKEGVSNYYTLKALLDIGFLNEQSYLEILNKLFYRRYMNDEGLGNISLSNGESKHEHWGIIYGGGLFAGIAFDVMIRKNTKNQKSLNEILKRLYLNGNDPYSFNELRALISSDLEDDETSFFEDHILGSIEIPIGLYLNMAGFSAIEDTGNLIIRNNPEPTELEIEIRKGFFGEIND